ncbi:metalloregulator ArsR/SmtB family transcription factor [Nocardia mexicana]|uniref:ArsR family transcriptional regulator n=1 Tax=Nocardia mexicana TaxID=279262 RepID=A0A370H2X1_9NOCA|nr:metalloregulator ArsR/SmtB family transcription factor [Nocardia mexicana]RDI50569.1 ArsR family transcriptional regulator [Nocardia mexicana]
MDDVAGAIADPVRREILEMLRGAQLTAGAIAAEFSISRPAVSRHLRVLRESGLVRDELVGRQRYYRLNIEPLREIASWLALFDRADTWEHHLDALATEVYRTRRERRAPDPHSTRENTA